MKNIIAVDDEMPALRLLKEAIEEAVPDCFLSTFSSVGDALEYAGNNVVDVAFLDIKMPGMSGLMLAKHLKDFNGQTNIVFVTGYSDYAMDAFSMSASGYLLKPVTAEAVRHEMGNLRYQPNFIPQGVWVQTFGNFDVFIDGKPVVFKLAKSKEILAYLIDRRGASVEKREIAAVLWDQGEYSRNRQIYLQELITGMMHSLDEAGISYIVRRWQGNLAIDVSRVECDYYNFINWDMHAINSYHGEYMTNYSWAELTAGILTDRKDGKGTKENGENSENGEEAQ